MRLYTVAAFATAFAGCTPELSDPTLASVSPTWGWNGERTAIVAAGSQLYPGVRAASDGGSRTDTSFELWLSGPEDVEVESVAADGFSAIDGVVPAGLSVGLYDLEVRTPTGRAATLADAFEVTDTRADHLVMSIDAPNNQVGDWVIAELGLSDPDGDIVPVDVGKDGLLVEVRVATDSLEDLSFLDDALAEQEPLASGDGVRGRLGLDGTGFVSFTSAAPQVAQIDVVAADEASIDHASDVVTWTAGAPNQVRIELPRADYSTIAGNSFSARLTLLDEDGNETNGASANLLLYDVCGSTFQQVSLADRTTVTVMVTEASGTTACAEQRLIAQGSGAYGESSAFEVQPDVPVDLVVSTWPASVTAGGDPLKVLVAAQDQWGNALLDTEGGLALEDDAGGLSAATDVGEQDCEDFIDGLAFCTAILWRAGAEVHVAATSASGLTGTSAAFEVLPSEAASLSVVVEELSVVAGEAFPVVVKVSDGFGNPLDIDPAGGDAPTFTDLDGTTIACSWVGAAGTDNAEAFGCVATIARTETISAAIPSRSVQGSSDSFDVVNGELTTVDLDVGGVTSVTAGSSLTLAASAYDAYGNSYEVQSANTLDLSDLSGSVSPTTLTLDATGSGSATLTFTKATTGNRISGSFAGVVVGSSPAFAVTAASLDHIEIIPSRTWAWISTPLKVQVRAVDAWDNPVSTYSGSPVVTSSKSLGSLVTVTSLATGEAEVEFTWSRAGLQDTLRLTDGARSAVSTAVDVLDPSCASGPTAGVTAAGATTTTLCRTSGTTASTTVSGGSSTAGASTISAYHFDLGDGDWSRQSSSSLTTTWVEEGQYDVSLVVADSSACGSQAAATVWVADDDGEPAGPVTVTVADETLVAGSATDGVTDVDLTAFDCSGDVSRYGLLYLRADLGDVESSGVSAVAATGAGLTVALDSSGQGTVSWTMAGTSDDGDATLYAGVLSGGALGSAGATVSGESRRPRLLQVDPFGATSELFDTVTLGFSEPMLTTSATTARVQLTDPGGDDIALTSDDLTFDSTRETLTASMPELLDAASGVWVLTISSGVRDASGNQLDGLFAGSASAFVLNFGAVGDTAPSTTACTPDTSSFTPDGDPGTGSEADEATFSLTAAAAPAWWRVEASDADGEVVLIDQASAGSSATGAWVFDGRDQEGLILPAGTYQLSFTGLDEHWNEGAACAAEVEVIQQYGS